MNTKFNILKNIRQKIAHLVVFASVILFILLSIYACDDIIEPDLSEATIELISPSDNARTGASTQVFLWDDVKLKGRDSLKKLTVKYHLQVVAPSFDTINQLLADTSLNIKRFTLNLIKGRYQWRVRAENGSSRSAYFIRTLQVDSSTDLRNQKVNLLFPLNRAYLNRTKVRFKWDKLFYATNYEVLVKGGNDFENKFTTVYDTITVSGLTNGQFTWGVFASNNSTRTVNKNIYIFIIDTIPPVKPLINSPDSITYQTLPIDLTWKHDDGIEGRVMYDSLVIASDRSFNKDKIIKILHKNDISNSKYNLTKQDIGDKDSVYWRIISVDSAGNKSPAVHRKLRIKSTTSIVGPKSMPFSSDKRKFVITGWIFKREEEILDFC